MKWSFCLISIFSLTLFFSCSDPCEDLNCNTGVCVDGTCDCPEGFSGVNCEIEDLCFNNTCVNGECNPNTGACECSEFYEGENCDIEIRAKFYGDWSSTDFECGNEGAEDFIINFSQGTFQNELIAIDVDDPDIQVITIVEGNELIINQQTFMDSGQSFTIGGSGTYDSTTNTITLTYIVNEDGETATCIGTFTKI